MAAAMAHRSAEGNRKRPFAYIGPMIRTSTLAFLLGSTLLPASAQFTTLTLHVNDGNGGDTFIHDGPTQQYNNYSNVPALNIYAWTNSGQPGIKRSFLKFDLSIVPPDAVVNNARLSLFYNPDDAAEGIDTHSGDNDWVIQRTVSPWDPTTVTWNTQPQVTDEHAVSMPAAATGTDDFVDIDVTDLVRDMLAAGDGGFRLSLQVENIHRMLILASSEDPVPARRPRLELDVELRTGIDDAPSPTSVQVWSTTDAIEVAIHHHAADVRVMDLTGREVHSTRINGGLSRIGTQGWAPGKYLVQVIDQDGRPHARPVIVAGY